MIRLSIRRKIMGIAVTLIALMAITAVLTVVLVMQVGTRIEELTYNYNTDGEGKQIDVHFTN
jgi:adenylate cyclase